MRARTRGAARPCRPLKKSQARIDSPWAPQEGAPRLPVALQCRRHTGFAQDVADRGGRDGDAELAQLADDPQVAPARFSRRAVESVPVSRGRSADGLAAGEGMSNGGQPSDDASAAASQLSRGSFRLSTARSNRSCGSKRECGTCRRRIDIWCRRTRISNSLARSPRAISTTSSSNRHTRTYNDGTSKGGLQ
jgi:hypothetical protein